MKKKYEFEVPISGEFAKQGFGQFPYVILRLFNATYMQFPIHFETENTVTKPGIHITINDGTQYASKDQFLLNTVTKFKSHLDQKWNRSHRLCLVLDTNKAYYFEDDIIKFNNVIPTGGALLNSKEEFIAKCSNHYTDNQAFASC